MIDDIFGLAVRLLRGEVVDMTDDAGRAWRATATSLAVMFNGEANPVLEGAIAFDVARELATRLRDAALAS